MDVSTELKTSLQYSPRYIPSWYLYDSRGSRLFEDILAHDTHYYFTESEKEVLHAYIRKCISSTHPPSTLIEFGSGSSNKTRWIIDTLLENMSTLTYVPVDISADFLQESCDALKKDYNERLDIKMIPADYDTAIDQIRQIRDTKIVLWLGGFQNQSVDNMVRRLTNIADSISDKDVVLLTVDITQDTIETQAAYLDPKGTCERFYRNAFERLNVEMGCDISDSDVDIEAEFVESLDDNMPSRILVRARSTRTQSHYIRGLDMTLRLDKGEYINLYEGEGYSFKYTRDQMDYIARACGLRLTMYADSSHHAALCHLQRI